MSQMQLLDLNDDCLIAILRRVSLVELVLIAGTCQRLQRLSQDVFGFNRQFLCVNLPLLITNLESTTSMEIYFEEHFRHFGHLVTQISAPWPPYSNEQARYEAMMPIALNAISSYCSGGNLEVLILHGFKMTLATDGKAQQLFAGLKKIKLVSCGGNWWPLLAASKECQDLRFSNPTCISEFHFDLPKLESFSLFFYDDDFSDDEFDLMIPGLEGFLLRHNKLRELALTTLPSMNLSFFHQFNQLQKFSPHTPNELEQTDQLKPLQKLVDLKELSLHECVFNGDDILHNITCPVSVEKLKISETIVCHRYMDVLNRFCNLRHLALSEVGVTGGFQTLIDGLHLNNLIQLELLECTIKTDDVVQMVEKFHELQLIKLRMKSDQIKIDRDLYERLVAVCGRQNKKLEVDWLTYRSETNELEDGVNTQRDLVEIFTEGSLPVRGRDGYFWNDLEPAK